ncbi:MAG: homocysteine S-methyltransferase family protein [Candidatus Neomarinimicrobiota bacterium]|jgi:5-methyltetrahydrofolate--homocysteine methyltransferase|nr:homocysteine S-methyltransferase family protein [Candidatus Neomarinimicrobiota bacterium]MDD3966873.1 homocysteine S-methyltransferase family protein [Candidatus Neomarinimicrobiota bacterium]
MRIPFIQAVQSGKILLSDGAWGTFLQAEGLKSGDCPEAWNLSHPERVEAIARSYIESGSDMVETNTFGGSRHKLKMYGLGDKTYELNKAGAALSRKAAGEDAWVLGSAGPSGAILLTGEISEEELYEDFLIQMTGLLDGGADAICLETFSALDEAELAIRAARTSGLPLICTFTFENGFSMMGVTPEAYAEKMLELGVDVLGTNCGNGLKGMLDIVSRIRKTAAKHPLLVHANAGLPQLQGNEVLYPESPEHMAAAVPDIIAAGAGIIGGCCGTTPEHIRAMKKCIETMKGRTKP